MRAVELSHAKDTTKTVEDLALFTFSKARKRATNANIVNVCQALLKFLEPMRLVSRMFQKAKTDVAIDKEPR